MIINNNITKKTKKQIKTCQENIVVRRKENFNNGHTCHKYTVSHHFLTFHFLKYKFTIIIIICIPC